MKKKLLSALLSVSLVATLLVGCGGAAEEAPAATDTTEEAPAEEETASAEGGSVYYLNFYTCFFCVSFC